jgi:hypothetical protein
LSYVSAVRLPRHSEVDGHRVRIQTLEVELHYLQDRTRATIDQLHEHRGRLAAIEGKVAFVGCGACE